MTSEAVELVRHRCLWGHRVKLSSARSRSAQDELRDPPDHRQEGIPVGGPSGTGSV